MMKINKIVVFTVCVVLFVACDYLDVVPNDTATLEHAFSNRSVTEKFLRTCYSFLPDVTNPNYPGWLTSRDEFDYGYELRAQQAACGLISIGYQNTDNPYLDYWSGTNGGKPLYVGIRDCNIFLENIHKPRDILEEERARWIAEVKFLKAYYHFFLMQLYGPIVLVDENLPVSASPEEVKVYREPIDEVVDFIVALLDEALPDLPMVLPDPASEQGRITKIIALAVKAKVLAWAASPIFNGNEDYTEWVDNRGKQLVSSTYDPGKWQRAADAIKNAIDSCHHAGMRLYTFNKYMGGPHAYNMNDTLVKIMTIRKAITEDLDRNPGIIWATQHQFSEGKGSITNNLDNLLKQFMPRLYTQDLNSYGGYFAASWYMGELFYSNNGVPIEEDKFYNYAGRYVLRRATPGDGHESYIATGETTVELHFNREYRFYASLAIDRGFYELASTTKDGGATFSPFIKLRQTEIYPERIAYYPKKIIPFESAMSQGDANKRYTPHNYQFPLIRLSDLYLLYSEALNEVKAKPDAEVYHWIDLVRENAGLKGVVESWEAAANNPQKPTTKTGMRSIIRQERLIELAFEVQRYWDLRRWKIAPDYWSLPPRKWSFNYEIPEEPYAIINYAPAVQFTFKDLLFPIREHDLRINNNLVQSYGW